MSRSPPCRAHGCSRMIHARLGSSARRRMRSRSRTAVGLCERLHVKRSARSRRPVPDLPVQLGRRGQPEAPGLGGAPRQQAQAGRERRGRADLAGELRGGVPDVGRPALQRQRELAELPLVCRAVLGSVHGQVHRLPRTVEDRRAPTAHLDPRPARNERVPCGCRGLLGAGQPAVQVDHRLIGRGRPYPRVGVHDAADVVDPGHAVGVRVAERRQHLLGGIDLARRDEQIGVRVAAVLAGRVEQRG